MSLIEPAERVDVVAGSTATIAWGSENAPAGIEEWEAFISIDGGQTYPIRITPHLDASIQRCNWIVPSLPGAEVSILLRFGDERQEHEFQFPARMRITEALPLDLLRRDAVFRTALIESELEDDHGRRLIAWVNGSREGSDLRQVIVDDLRLVSDHEWNRYRDRDCTPAIGSSSKRVACAMDVSRSRGDDVAGSRLKRLRPLRHHYASILPMIRRLNI